MLLPPNLPSGPLGRPLAGPPPAAVTAGLRRRLPAAPDPPLPAVEAGPLRHSGCPQVRNEVPPQSTSALSRWQSPLLSRVDQVRIQNRTGEKARGRTFALWSCVAFVASVWLSRPGTGGFVAGLLPDLLYVAAGLTALAALAQLLAWRIRTGRCRPAHSVLSMDEQKLLGVTKDMEFPQEDAIEARRSRYQPGPSDWLPWWPALREFTARPLSPRAAGRAPQPAPAAPPLGGATRYRPAGGYDAAPVMPTSLGSIGVAAPRPMSWPAAQPSTVWPENDIRTEADLDRLLQETAAVAPPTGLGSSAMHMQPEFRQYQRSFRQLAIPTSSLASLSTSTASDNIADMTSLEISQKVDETLGQVLGIADKAESWAETVKVWLVRTVIAPLQDDIQQCDAFFHQNANRIQNHFMLLSSSALHEPYITGNFGAQKSRQQFLEEAYNNTPKGTHESRIIMRRVMLERYLNLSANPSLRPRTGIMPDVNLLRQYALARIKEFAQDPLLSRTDLEQGKDLQFPGGVVIRWAESGLPNDALLLLHLFSAYFDEHTPAIGGLPFMQRHYVDCPTDLRQAIVGSAAGAVIAHTLWNRKPYFCVVSRLAPERPAAHRAPGPVPECYRYFTKQGRNSLFQAIAVFMHLHKAANNSILDTVDISKPPISQGPPCHGMCAEPLWPTETFWIWESCHLHKSSRNQAMPPNGSETSRADSRSGRRSPDTDLGNRLV